MSKNEYYKELSKDSKSGNLVETKKPVLKQLPMRGPSLFDKAASFLNKAADKEFNGNGKGVKRNVKK
jgi:hypothetical protein